MALRAKYQSLIDAATKSGVTNLQVREQGNVLYIDGNAPSEEVKKACGIYTTKLIRTTGRVTSC